MNTAPCYVSNLIPISPNYNAREGSPGPSESPMQLSLRENTMQLPTPLPCPVLYKTLEAQSLHSCPQNTSRKRKM